MAEETLHSSERAAPPPAMPASPAPEPSPIPPPPACRSRVVAVANQKGGVGKTTTVINLAACLAELGQRTLVVDLDPQCNATSGLGLAPRAGVSLYQALLGNGDMLTLIQPTALKLVDIVPSELDLAGAEVDIARTDAYLHCFRGALQPVTERGIYPFILVDCPPSLGILTMNALTAADSALVPMQCEYYALEGLSVITRLIQRLRDGGANRVLEMEGILMTMYDGRVRLGADVIREVSRHFSDKVYNTIIPRNVRLSEAPSFGKPVVEYDRDSSGARAYRLLAEEFLRRRGVAVGDSAPGENARRTPLPTLTSVLAAAQV
jgi:chromosome partitioning protein